MDRRRRRINCLGSSYKNRPSVILYCGKEEQEKHSEVLTSEEFPMGKISLNRPRFLCTYPAKEINSWK
jgi:hypothetical protein